MALSNTNPARELTLRHVETTKFANSPTNSTKVELNSVLRFSFLLLCQCSCIKLKKMYTIYVHRLPKEVPQWELTQPISHAR